MTLLTPLGLLAGLLAVPVVALHVLRPYRQRTVVSSTYLWRRFAVPVASTQPWQRLRPSVPLVLQLLLVALLALALAGFSRTTAAPLPDHTVFIIDVSGSMAATDVPGSRVEGAKQRVRDLLGQLPDGAAASLVVASAEPEVAIAETTDLTRFTQVLDRLRPGTAAADFAGAFTLAESLVSATRITGWVLVGDGGLTPDEQRLAPPGLRYEAVGRRDVNRAITSLAVAPQEGVMHALVTVANTGGPATEQPLRIDVDGVTIERRTLSLPAGGTEEVSVPLPPGSRVQAFLDGEDLLGFDDSRAAVAPLAADLTVTVVTDGAPSVFVTEALEALGATVHHVGPGDPSLDDPDAPADSPPDLVVYDGVDVPAEPTRPFVSIAAPTPPAGVQVTGAIERPVAGYLADDPILDSVDVTTTAIATAQALSVDPEASGVEVLVGSAQGEPLVLTGRSGELRWFHVAFALEQSNLPVTVAYPILFTRMVHSLTLADDVPASVEAGARLPSLDVAVTLTAPRGEAIEVPPGRRMPVMGTPGYWTVETPDGAITPVAVVFPARESPIAVADELTDVPPAADPADAPAAADPGRSERTVPLLRWLLIAALVVVAAELAWSWRSMGVGPRQLVAALVVETIVVLVLVGALVNVSVTRHDDDVRAVLVIDRSASPGPSGKGEIDRFADAVIAAADRDAIAVVEVGADAQVAAGFGVGPDTTRAAPSPDGTDLVHGLRLAASLLDGSTRERIVLLSDGRATTGVVGDEVARLADLGIVLDVHQVAPDLALDVAVATIDAPTTVGPDESYELTATVTATAAARVTLDLFADGEPADAQEVDLLPGDNEVTFARPGGTSGLERYEVVVRESADAHAENDRAHTAVAIEGTPRVLIVEEEAGEAEPIAGALSARAVEADTVDVGDMPAADELGTYTAVVLVDVPAPALGPDQTAALDEYVRQQGNGLVVIGGRDAFALGGYADSDLEQLLPVESRTEDPTRKADVAEVVLIDASESMGACHCAEDGGMMTSTEGGVNKTDISRAGAANAAAALSADDEIGVLAFNATTDWVVPLQPVSAAGDLTGALSDLAPAGETQIGRGLEAAADGLRASSKELRHIILFTDGFSPELFSGNGPMGEGSTGELEEQAAALLAEGITVSVVATGEGAAPLLEDVAEAGGGRFYPGHNLEELPDLFVEEARLAARNFINEGNFVPGVTSTAAPVRGLTEAPSLSGYQATTAKDTTDVMLQVGEFADPLLSSWRVGLGKVTAWTSDSGEAWAADWAGWSGWADFWSAVVRDTFALEGAEGFELTTRMTEQTLEIELVADDPLAAGATPTARVQPPSGTAVDVELRRVDAHHFRAALPAAESGAYSVSVTSSDPETSSVSRLAADVANRSYPVEYLPPVGTAPDMAAWSRDTGGRGSIEAADVLSPDGLDSGRSAWHPRWWLMLTAALLWPLGIALRRVRWEGLRDSVRAAQERSRRPDRLAGRAG